MVEGGKDLRGSDPYTLLEWVDAVADRFESSWQNGQPRRIEDYLDDTVGEKRTLLLRELAKIDLERRLKAGESRRWEDYVREFPELQGEEEAAADWCDTYTDAINQGKRPLIWPAEFLSIYTAKPPVIEGYEILAELGHGGMGSVYKARQQSLKRIVALKVIRSAVQADPKHLARFQVEAEAAARLQHPNIAQIYEVGRHEGLPYLAMEYVDGGSLAQLLRGKPQPTRSAAELVATLARSMQYAHEHGVVHRDLKPANILLQPNADAGGGGVPASAPAGRVASLSDYVPKITDFGLAKLLESESGHTLSGAIVGTPSYMAPEQAAGKAHDIGPAVDTYALGAILYELLTGGPPFKGASVLDTLEQVRTADPVRPSHLVPKLPRDLETICLKALARAPAGRYVSAGALADDLDRFLNREPIHARPIGVAGRLWRWCRRRPALAGLVATAAALLITIVVASVLVAVASIAQEKTRLREGLIQQLQLVRANAHVNGWSDEVWRLATEAAALRKDTALRTLAAACTGLDARPGQYLEKASVSWVAFDSSGQRVLLGGRNDSHGRPLEGTKLWDLQTNRLQIAKLAGPGPVAFNRDGQPVHLVWQPGAFVVLWNLADQKRISEGPLSSLETAATGMEISELGFPVLALSSDASIAAAAVKGKQGSVIVWDAGAGRVILRCREPAGALALAPAGNLLATGNSKGQVSVWKTPEDKTVLRFEIGRVTIYSLSFSPDGKRLAVGDSAGTVTILDLEGRRPIAYCLGSHHDVYALAFSPDGTLIASGGRGPVRLWDAATGRLVLSLRASSPTTALAFSPDGRRLVVGSKAPARASIWELDPGHGIQTLRGLTSQASHVRFSHDGRRLAGLAHNGQVAIWNVEGGRLRYLLSVPQANPEDDAALAFSPDGSRFAFAAGTGARLWEMGAGRPLGAWPLRPGAKDALAFHSSGALLLFREEEDDGGVAGRTPEARRVCRIRNLLGPSPREPLATIADFDGHLLDTAAASDGAAFVAEGTFRTADGLRRAIRAYDGLTGKQRWSIPSRRSQLAGTLAVDPIGELLAAQLDNREKIGSLVVAATGQIVAALEPFPVCLAPEARKLVRFDGGDLSAEERGFGVYERDDSSPRLVLGIDTTPAFRPAFSRDGNRLAWSNADGTVSVCDLRQLGQRLSQVGLEWEEPP
jgi:serine/threonine protein kinase/WD40 repeat protein